MAIEKIISGGQTGADRGGLDAAIDAGVPHGGWCPKGRKAEDGPIPARYALLETASADYLVRTERNVIDSDATIVFIYGKPQGGSKRTVEFAKQHSKPCLAVDVAALDDETAADAIAAWIAEYGGQDVSIFGPPPAVTVLNCAGSRESKSRGIQERVRHVMTLVLQKAHSAH